MSSSENCKGKLNERLERLKCGAREFHSIEVKRYFFFSYQKKIVKNIRKVTVTVATIEMTDPIAAETAMMTDATVVEV